MPFSFDQFLTWLIIGLIGGSLTGVIVRRERRGFGIIVNLVLGCGGAIVGGLLFRFFKIFPELDKISISLRDLLSAFFGSLLVLAAVWIWQNYNAGQRREY